MECGEDLGPFLKSSVVLFLLLERRKKASAWERNLVYPAVMVLLLIETVGIDLPGCIKQIILYLLFENGNSLSEVQVN